MKFITCSGVPELSLCGRLWFARVGTQSTCGTTWEEAWDKLAEMMGG